MNRREALQIALQAAAAGAAGWAGRAFAGPAGAYSDRALELVARAQVFDMLGVFTVSDKRERAMLREPGLFTAEDVRKVLDSGIDVFHNAIGIGGPDAFGTVLHYLGAWNGFIADHAEHFSRIDSIADLDRLEQSGKAGIILGLQNSEHFRSVDDVDLFYGLGQRVSQLTYNSQNFLASGSTDRADGGISDFGAAIIERMNQVGMIVDVSHCGDRTTLEAFDVSSKPVLVTHSNCRALVPGHPRLKTDEAIRKMAKTGGVMGITAVRMFVRNAEPTTVEHVVDHVDHVVNLVGVEHVGVGTDADLDGYDDLPVDEYQELKDAYKSSYAFRDKIDTDGMDHPKKIFDLTDALIRRGYDDSEILAILGGNFRRAIGQIW
jgi:membrane dipeptidase